MKVPERFTSIKGNNDLLQQVIDQLNKDVHGFMNEFKWEDAEDAYQNFVVAVEKEVKALSRSQLMQVLYRIDISEQKMRLVWTLEEENQNTKITQLILDRELQKVLTRLAYKNRNN